MTNVGKFAAKNHRRMAPLAQTTGSDGQGNGGKHTTTGRSREAARIQGSAF